MTGSAASKNWHLTGYAQDYTLAFLIWTRTTNRRICLPSSQDTSELAGKGQQRREGKKGKGPTGERPCGKEGMIGS